MSKAMTTKEQEEALAGEEAEKREGKKMKEKQDAPEVAAKDDENKGKCPTCGRDHVNTGEGKKEKK
jgi:DNA repair exonuclease SbcCD ATPase subunit